MFLVTLVKPIVVYRKYAENLGTPTVYHKFTRFDINDRNQNNVFLFEVVATVD